MIGSWCALCASDVKRTARAREEDFGARTATKSAARVVRLQRDLVGITRWVVAWIALLWVRHNHNHMKHRTPTLESFLKPQASRQGVAVLQLGCAARRCTLHQPGDQGLYNSLELRAWDDSGRF